jgi:Flavodoxin domain
MHALVVYESMYGNTHRIAEQIADGLRPKGDVKVVAVSAATEDLVDWADLVVVGSPTHVHGLTGSRSRQGAREAAAKPGSPLTLDAAADGPGIREWFGSLSDAHHKHAAAFDTRFAGPALLTGRASGGIANGLRRHGFDLVVEPESFLVDKQTQLVAGEADRATIWGAGLAAASPLD